MQVSCSIPEGTQTLIHGYRHTQTLSAHSGLTESHSRGAVPTWAKQESPEKCAAAADVPEGHTHLKDNVINM